MRDYRVLMVMKMNHYFPLYHQPSLLLLSHLKQMLLRLLTPPQQQWRCHGLRGRSYLSKRVARFSTSSHLSYFTNMLFVALFEPRDVGHALSYLSWFNAMHEELENFERNQVWTLVVPPRDVNVIGIK
jgi:hypothetical protein